MKIADIKYKLLSNEEIHYLRHYSAEVLIEEENNKDYIFSIEFKIEQSAIDKEIIINILEDINYPTILIISAIKQWIIKNLI